MKKTDYEFTFEGFNFMANFEIDAGGLHLTGLWLESGIDDELIEVTEIWRLALVERHLSKVFKNEIDLCIYGEPIETAEPNTSSTFRIGY
jgi:hypothetical protein